MTLQIETKHGWHKIVGVVDVKRDKHDNLWVKLECGAETTYPAGSWYKYLKGRDDV